MDDTTEMVISQFGKTIRIGIKSVCAAGHATKGARLLDLDADDKVDAAMVIPRRPQKLPKAERCCNRVSEIAIASFK
jgi:DNA gyrase subunit A